MMRILSAALLTMAIAAAAMIVSRNTSFFRIGAQEVSAGADVRISAQHLANGQVQFGPGALSDSGEYADPVEPRVNSTSVSSARGVRMSPSAPLLVTRPRRRLAALAFLARMAALVGMPQAAPPAEAQSPTTNVWTATLTVKSDYTGGTSAHGYNKGGDFFARSSAV